MFKKRDLSLSTVRKFDSQNQEQIQKTFGLSLHSQRKNKRWHYTPLMGRAARILSKTGCIALESVIETYAVTWIQITTDTTSRNIFQVMEASYRVLNAPKETQLVPAQARVPHLPKRVITSFRLKISNSSSKTVILENWINLVYSSCMSSWLFGSQLLLRYHDFHGQKQNISTHHSQGWLRQLNYLRMASWSSLWHIFVSEKAGKENNVAERSRWPMSYHYWSDDLRGLNLFVYSHICEKPSTLSLC